MLMVIIDVVSTFHTNSSSRDGVFDGKNEVQWIWCNHCLVLLSPKSPPWAKVGWPVLYKT